MTTTINGRGASGNASACCRPPKPGEVFHSLPSNVIEWPSAGERTMRAVDPDKVGRGYADLYRQAASLYHQLEDAGQATDDVTGWFLAIETALDNLAGACCRGDAA